MARREGQRHHVMFPRKLHAVMPETRRIRQQPSLIPQLDSDTHQALHAELGIVPVPDYHMARRVARDFVPDNDPMVALDNLLFAYGEAVQHPRARVIEKSLGGLIIASLEIQRPFIREGWVHGAS